MELITNTVVILRVVLRVKSNLSDDHACDYLRDVQCGSPSVNTLFVFLVVGCIFRWDDDSDTDILPCISTPFNFPSAHEAAVPLCSVSSLLSVPVSLFYRYGGKNQRRVMGEWKPFFQGNY